MDQLVGAFVSDIGGYPDDAARAQKAVVEDRAVIDGGVDAVAAVEEIVAGPPDQYVVAGAAEQHVVAGLAVQLVVAIVAMELIAAVAAEDQVVPSRPKR